MDERVRRAVILTALEVEFNAVAEHLNELHEEVHPLGDVYTVGSVSPELGGLEVCVAQVGVGNTRAALGTERAINFLAPSTVLFVGVGGGIKDVSIGDVVAATKVYGYESGKDEKIFLPRPEVCQSSFRMEQRARAESRRDHWIHRIIGDSPKKQPRVLVGPTAAGEKVVADTRSATYRFLRLAYSDAILVEMEGRGFLTSTWANNVDALVVRGVSDLIDRKAEADATGSQELAARHASAFAIEVLCKLGPRLDSTDSDGAVPEVARAEAEIVINMRASDLNGRFFAELADLLRRKTDGGSMTIKYVDVGSIVIGIESTEEGLGRLSALFEKGELYDILGWKVLAFRRSQHLLTASRDAPTSVGRCIAVLGAGLHGARVIRVMDELGALKTVVDPTRQGRERALASAPGVQVFDDIEVVLNDPEVSAVIVMTPAETHLAAAKAAIDVGKDVFVRMPLTIDIEETQDLIHRASSANRIIMVDHILEYHPAIVRLRELIQSGELGRIRYVIGNRLNFLKARSKENALSSFAPQDVAITLSLVGAYPIEVSTTGGSYSTPDVADVTLMQLLFETGVRAHLFVSWLHPFKEQRLVVIGSKKMASFDDVAKKLVLYDQHVDWEPGQPVPVRGEGIEIEFPDDEPLKEECRHFLQSVADRATPRTNGQTGLEVMRVLHAAQRSLMSNGQPILLDVERWRPYSPRAAAVLEVIPQATAFAPASH